MYHKWLAPQTQEEYRCYTVPVELEESELKGNQLKYLTQRTQSILPPQPKGRALAILKYNPPYDRAHTWDGGRVLSSPQLAHYS